MTNTQYILKQKKTPKFWVGGAMRVPIEKYENKVMFTSKPKSISKKK